MTGWLSKWYMYSRCSKPQPKTTFWWILPEQSRGESCARICVCKRAMEVQGTSTETTAHNNSQDGVTHRSRTHIRLHDNQLNRACQCWVPRALRRQDDHLTLTSHTPSALNHPRSHAHICVHNEPRSKCNMRKRVFLWQKTTPTIRVASYSPQ